MRQTTPAFKGLITGILMVAASLFSFYVIQLPIVSKFQFVIYSIFCLGIAWSLVDYSKYGDPAKRKFKDFFSIGFKTFVVCVLIMAVYTFVFFTYNTDFRDEKIAENSRLLAEQGNHMQKEIEENAQQLKKMFMPLMISSAVFRYLIIGALFTALTAGFLSKPKSPMQ